MSGSIPDLALMMTNYGARLPQKIEEIARAIDDLRTDPTQLDRARVLAHKVHGTAGSYGYPNAGQAAGVVEDALLRLAADPGSTTVWAEIDAALVEAKRIAAAAAATAAAPLDSKAR